MRRVLAAGVFGHSQPRVRTCVLRSVLLSPPRPFQLTRTVDRRDGQAEALEIGRPILLTQDLERASMPMNRLAFFTIRF